ncbi:MAG: hypothetical protein EOO75_20070, partial [Myxococcales bacterium]
MAPFVRVWFDDGRLWVEGDGDRLGLAGRDAVRRSFMVPASAYGWLRREAARQGVAVDDEVAPRMARHSPAPGRRREVPAALLDLAGCIDPHEACGVRLPAGPEREALVALLVSSSPGGALVLCADDEAARGWRAALAGWLGAGPEPTVLALPRAVDRLRHEGDRFALVVVDDPGRLDERLPLALARAAAPQRLALLAPGEPPWPAGVPWPPVGDWTPGAAQGADATPLTGTPTAARLRLALPLDEDEAQGITAAAAIDDGGRRVRALTTLTRAKREKLRELILRHPEVTVAVATPARPGVGMVSLGALLDDLPLPARGAFLAREREGTLRFGALERLAEWSAGGSILLVTGAPRPARL